MAALVITLWLFTALPGSISQDKAPHPDLHGTWALVPSQSNFGEKQSNTTDYTITIIQQQSEIKITASYHSRVRVRLSSGVTTLMAARKRCRASRTRTSRPVGAGANSTRAITSQAQSTP